VTRCRGYKLLKSDLIFCKIVLCYPGIDVGLILTVNVEQFEDVEGYANETGILV